jgi:hypothetical protein
VPPRQDRARGDERGSAVVEFALVLPIVLVVALAMLQTGLIVKDQLLVVQAARAGARQAAVDPDVDAARSAAIEAGALEPSRTEVSIERAGARGLPVTVVVAYAAPIRVPFVDWLFPPSVRLSGRATMRQEFA